MFLIINTSHFHALQRRYSLDKFGACPYCMRQSGVSANCEECLPFAANAFFTHSLPRISLVWLIPAFPPLFPNRILFVYLYRLYVVQTTESIIRRSFCRGRYPANLRIMVRHRGGYTAGHNPRPLDEMHHKISFALKYAPSFSHDGSGRLFFYFHPSKNAISRHLQCRG